MYFSGKITNSVLSFLAKEGVDLATTFEQTNLPTEFLRDPTCWLEADEVEEFLRIIEQEHSSLSGAESFFEKVGHQSHELKAWGVLDSVLRMMQQPEELFNHPERILSYFISPPPPIGSLSKSAGCVEFEIPISSDQYPYVTKYLTSALESLPCFMSGEFASTTWQQSKIKICWADQQSQFFDKSSSRNIKPELIHSLMVSLEEAQKQLEELRRVSCEKDKQVVLLEKQLLSQKMNLQSSQQGVKGLNPELLKSFESYLGESVQDFQKLGDFFVRAQQLVTLLVGQDRMNPQIREAMRRVDWEFVKSNATQVMSSGIEKLQQSRGLFEGIEADLEVSDSDTKEVIDLNQLVEKAIEKVSAKLPKKVKIHRMLFLDRPVPVYVKQMRDTIDKLLLHSVKQVGSEGQIRIVTRPKGQTAEIEFTDTAQGFEGLRGHQELWDQTQNLVNMHDGQMPESKGSSFVIDLPF